MTKKPGIVWTYYNKKVDGSQIVAYCKYCNQSYIQNATRMEKHLVRCEKCPESVKQTFAKHRMDPANGQPRKTTWIEQKSINTSDMPNEWPETYDTVNVNYEITEDIDLTLETEVQPQHVSSNESLQNNGDWEQVSIKCSESPAPSASTDFNSAPPQERASVSHPRKAALNRRIWPGLSPKVAGHSPLQSKILQEQLLERRIWRRVAELELRKKNLEVERLQWEYERDKMQSELKLAHESRMMEIREEREKQMLEREMADVIKRQRSLVLEIRPNQTRPVGGSIATMTERLVSFIGNESFYYIAVKGSPFATDCAVFGLASDEVLALSKRFPNSGTTVVNGVIIKGPPIAIINALAELGYRIVSSTGEAEILWTLQREI